MTAIVPTGSEAPGNVMITGSAGSDLLEFNLKMVPLIFRHLEEVRRSLVRLCLQRDRLRKEVRDLSSKVMKFDTTAEKKKMGVKKQEYGRYMWIKKEIKVAENYTDIPCRKEKKRRNHRGFRKKKQDINSIINRCRLSFQQLTPKAQHLPLILSQLPTLLTNGFNDHFFFESLIKSMRNQGRPTTQSKVFTGSTPRNVYSGGAHGAFMTFGKFINSL